MNKKLFMLITGILGGVVTIADCVLDQMSLFEGFQYELSYTLNLLKDTQRKWQRTPLPDIKQGRNYLFKELYKYYSYGNINFAGRRVTLLYHLYHIAFIFSHIIA